MTSRDIKNNSPHDRDLFEWVVEDTFGNKYSVDELKGSESCLWDVVTLILFYDKEEAGHFTFGDDHVVILWEEFRHMGLGKIMYKTVIMNFGEVCSSDIISKYSYNTWSAMAEDDELVVFENNSSYSENAIIPFTKKDTGIYIQPHNYPIFTAEPVIKPVGWWDGFEHTKDERWMIRAP